MKRGLHDAHLLAALIYHGSKYISPYVVFHTSYLKLNYCVFQHQYIFESIITLSSLKDVDTIRSKTTIFLFTMEFIVKKSGSRTLLYQGHTYSKPKESKNTIRWRCTKRQSLNCSGTKRRGTIYLRVQIDGVLFVRMCKTTGYYLSANAKMTGYYFAGVLFVPDSN